MTAYLYKLPTTNDYIWKSGWGIDGVIVEAPDITQLDKIIPTNLTLEEKIVWLNRYDAETYQKHHKGFMSYKTCFTYTQLRKIINEWNNKRPIADRIKGVYKMKKEELLIIAEGGKYQ